MYSQKSKQLTSSNIIDLKKRIQGLKRKRKVAKNKYLDPRYLKYLNFIKSKLEINK